MDASHDEKQILPQLDDLACQALAKLQKSIPKLLAGREGTLACSFPWRNHPECDKLEAFARSWAWRHFGSPQARAIHGISYRKMIDSDFHLLATMSMAAGRSERMNAAVKLMLWFFVFDNFMDEPAHMGADTEASQDMVDAIMSVFRVQREAECPGAARVEYSGPGCAEGSAAWVLREAARDWWVEMQQLGMSARQQRRFVSVFGAYLDANAAQVAFRERCQIPDLETYKALRLDSIGWYVSSVLLEFAVGMDLPDEVLEHPLVSALERAAAFHITFVNDVFSFRKELSDGDLMNVVPVLLCHNMGLLGEGGDARRLAREAEAQVVRLLRELDGECARLMAQIRAAAFHGPEVESFLQGISDWLAGNLRWHRLTARYRVGQPAL